MKYKTTSILKDGLCNKLFQISAAYAYAKQYDRDLVFYDDLYIASSHDNINSYKYNIFSRVPFENSHLNTKWISYNEPEFAYRPIPQYDSNLALNGYFQSFQYFIPYLEEIKHLFSFDKTNKIKDEYSNILNKKNCSIHVRRGDYLKLSDHHPVQSIDYYNQAVELFDIDTLFIVFSDDIEWCKTNFSYNAIFIEGNSPDKDLYLMSLCQDHIISNSTFGWWGSMMSNNIESKTIAPKKWFGSSYTNNNTQHLYPTSWIII
jgi:hypothetical protein